MTVVRWLASPFAFVLGYFAAAVALSFLSFGTSWERIAAEGVSFWIAIHAAACTAPPPHRRLAAHIYGAAVLVVIGAGAAFGVMSDRIDWLPNAVVDAIGAVARMYYDPTAPTMAPLRPPAEQPDQEPAIGDVVSISGERRRVTAVYADGSFDAELVG